MNDPQSTEERLWNYIDGSVTDDERSFIERLLQSDAEWKAKYAEIMEVQQMLNNNVELEEPSMRFTQNVMEEISRLYITPAAGKYINKNIIRGLAFFFITMIVGVLGYAFGLVDWSRSASGMPNFNITNLDWSKLFNSTYMNIFMMVNIVLGLMLLDMYLTRSKRAQREKIINP